MNSGLIEHFISIKTRCYNLNIRSTFIFSIPTFSLKYSLPILKNYTEVHSAEVLNVIKLLIKDLLSNDHGMMFLKNMIVVLAEHLCSYTDN